MCVCVWGRGTPATPSSNLSWHHFSRSCRTTSTLPWGHCPTSVALFMCPLAILLASHGGLQSAQQAEQIVRVCGRTEASSSAAFHPLCQLENICPFFSSFLNVSFTAGKKVEVVSIWWRADDRWCLSEAEQKQMLVFTCRQGAECTAGVYNTRRQFSAAKRFCRRMLFVKLEWHQRLRGGAVLLPWQLERFELFLFLKETNSAGISVDYWRVLRKNWPNSSSAISATLFLV